MRMPSPSKSPWSGEWRLGREETEEVDGRAVLGQPDVHTSGGQSGPKRRTARARMPGVLHSVDDGCGVGGQGDSPRARS